MTIEDLIKPVEGRFFSLCENSRIKRLYVFGSIVSGEFDNSSDLDFMVVSEEDPSLERGRRLWKLWDELESLFGRKVDLITESQLTNKYLKQSVDRSKQIVYDRTLS